jgi:Putative lumazine-binding
MKNTIALIASILTISLTMVHGQEQENRAIEKACRDYVEGWAEGNIERVERGVSPELVKRTIGVDDSGMSFTQNMSASLLKRLTALNKEGVRAEDFEPGVPFKVDVFIYDVTGDYALAKAVNTKYGFFDYCELAKFNGEWKIINVLWDILPEDTL